MLIYNKSKKQKEEVCQLRLIATMIQETQKKNSVSNATSHLNLKDFITEFAQSAKRKIKTKSLITNSIPGLKALKNHRRYKKFSPGLP